MSNEATKMWSGRFREPLNPVFEQWQRSFPFDYVLFEAEIAASIAHARMIAAAGILSSAEEEKMIAGLRALASNISLTRTSMMDTTAPFAKSVAAAEDIHHFVELELTKEIGDLALKLHTGRSRNEQIATDMRLYVRAAIDQITNGLLQWIDSLLTLAEKSGTAAMPSYTHLQRAEPVLIAHWLQAYVSMAERDVLRLRGCKTRLNLCPLGSGAVAGATLALDRTIAAKELGFAAPTHNSMDATSDRDFLLEFAQSVAIMGVHLSRFAEEITLYASSEFGFIDLPEAFSTGSSAMPQKKNPDFTELLRGKSGRLAGAATALLTLTKGLPLAYNKDLQEGQEATFESATTAIDVVGLLAPFTSALSFRTERMEKAAQTGYLNAMAAATYLSNKGVPFRKAHEKIGNAVRFGLESGRELNELTLDELKQFGSEFEADFFDAITLQATIDCHDVIGGTATQRVQQAISSARERNRAMLEGK